MTKSVFAISDFVRRQTEGSEFSYWSGTDQGLLQLASDYFDKAKAGYRDGVCLVPVLAEGFFSALVVLEEGDCLEGTYKARQAGEEPRKSTCVTGKSKVAAVTVDLILYRHDVLAENNEQSSEAAWEIISINANSVDGEMPIGVGALLANHFELSGGTATGMTDSEFVATLKESVIFWKDKAFVSGSLSRVEKLEAENKVLK